jgi:hypothetical protein
MPPGLPQSRRLRCLLGLFAILGGYQVGPKLGKSLCTLSPGGSDATCVCPKIGPSRLVLRLGSFGRVPSGAEARQESVNSSPGGSATPWSAPLLAPVKQPQN